MASCSTKTDNILDLEAILNLMEEGLLHNDIKLTLESIDKDLTDASSLKNLYKCQIDDCNKTYKTKGGLTRHIKSSHEFATVPPKSKTELASKFNIGDFNKTLERSLIKLKKDECFPPVIRHLYDGFIMSREEVLTVYEHFEPCINCFCGAENFYPEFFAKVKSTPVIAEKLGTRNSTLLLHVALYYCS